MRWRVAPVGGARRAPDFIGRPMRYGKAAESAFVPDPHASRTTRERERLSVPQRDATVNTGESPGEPQDDAARSGDRPRTVTLADVAAAAGVSPATASRVLAGRGGARSDTAERVHAAADALQYRPSGLARSLRVSSSRTIGIIVTDIENPFYSRLVNAVETVAEADGYAALLCNANYDVARVHDFMNLLEERRVDGVVISVAKLDIKSSPWLAAHRVPIVLVDSPSAGLRAPGISSDNRLGGRLAIDHLLDLGHRRIGHIMPPRTILAARERLAGAKDGMRWAGHAGALAVVEVGRYDMAAGTKAMATLLRRHPDITAVFAYNDLMAIGAMDAIHRSAMGIPGDISIVGFDDIPNAAYCNPPLTTVRQSVEVMGSWAFRELRKEIAIRSEGVEAPADNSDGDRSQFTKTPVELKVRESTAAPHETAAPQQR
jgi:DNA-binding LacI/PurR family transcriptional regulator